jgi:uncharacterized membrane protein YphA (DoxX/SURF4 family)
MNTVLWIIQILLVLLFLFAGGTKLFMSEAALQQMAPPNSIVLPMLLLRFIGLCEVLGALGLILPGITRIRRGLTPLAACGLLIIMIGAVVITVMGLGAAAAITPLVAGVLCAVVAYGRRDWR